MDNISKNKTSKEFDSLWDEIAHTAVKNGIAKDIDDAHKICIENQPNPGFGCNWNTCPLAKYCPVGD